MLDVTTSMAVISANVIRDLPEMERIAMVFTYIYYITRQFSGDNLVSTCAQICREDIKFRKGCKITGFSMQFLHILNSSNSIASLYISYLNY